MPLWYRLSLHAFATTDTSNACYTPLSSHPFSSDHCNYFVATTNYVDPHYAICPVLLSCSRVVQTLFNSSVFWLSRCVRWFDTEVSGLQIGPVFKGRAVQQAASSWTAWPLKMGPIRSTKTSVSKHLTFRNPENGRISFNGVGSLRLRKNSSQCRAVFIYVTTFLIILTAAWSSEWRHDERIGKDSEGSGCGII